MLPKDSTAGRRRCKMALVTIRAFGVVLTDPPTRCSPASPDSLGYLSPLEYESQHNDGHAITNP